MLLIYLRHAPGTPLCLFHCNVLPIFCQITFKENNGNKETPFAEERIFFT